MNAAAPSTANTDDADRPFSIAALILTKNEADMIVNCIESLQWCDVVVVLDDHSDDATPELAAQAGATVIEAPMETTFAEKRTLLLDEVETDWICYIDADERVTPALAQEILVHAETNTAAAMTFERENILYGEHLEYGGWSDDLVTRVFRRDALYEWYGDIHESPDFDGEDIILYTPLIHLTHRSTKENLHKSAEWTAVEAELLAAERTAPVTVWTLLRKGGMELVRRILFKQAYKDGMAGWVEAVVQAMNRVMVYIQVWEYMQTPSIAERYQQQEEQIAASWELHREQQSQRHRPAQSRGYRRPQV